jgi:hypothetical protein
MVSQEGIFCMSFIVIRCNDFDRMQGICKAATIMSVLMKVYTVPCHDRLH